MKKCICMIAFIFGLVAGAFAQTTNSNYEVVTFGAPPNGGEWGDTISVAADGKGSILVLRRADPPVLVFNREGELQDAWGEGLFPDNHSIDVDPEGFVWVTDRTHDMVHKFTIDGQKLMTLGAKGVADDNSSTDTFNSAGDVAVAPNGDVFVLDGVRIVHFSKEGRFIKVIGGVQGTGPGEFDGSHAIALDSRGRLFVLERQEEARNPRIQILDQNGQFIEQWTHLAGLARPSGITISADDTVYIGESQGENITILKEGRVIEWIAGLEAAPHNITWDAGTGDFYLADSNLPGEIKKIVKK